MTNYAICRTLFILLAVAVLIPAPYAYSAQDDKPVDLDNDEMDVTLFRGAANNSYFAVYFQCPPRQQVLKMWTMQARASRSQARA